MKATITFSVLSLLLLTLPSPTLACIGAEAAGMGDAYVSAVDDVTAVYWNPAALVWVEPSFALGIRREVPYDYIAIKPNNNPLAYAYINKSDKERFLLIAYGQKITENSAWGFSIGPDDDPDNPYGITFDTSYLVKYSHWRIGLLWQDFLNVRPSVTWSNNYLTVCGEIYNLFSNYDERYEIRTGVSLKVLPFMSIQAGYRNYTSHWDVTYGGNTYRNILGAYDIDYGLTFYFNKLKISAAMEQTTIEDGYTVQNYLISGSWAFKKTASNL
jgi:hypothetical protein